MPRFYPRPLKSDSVNGAVFFQSFPDDSKENSGLKSTVSRMRQQGAKVNIETMALELF